MNECSCVPIKFYLWALISEFHILFLFHGIVLFGFFFFFFKPLSSWARNTQVAELIWPTGWGWRISALEHEMVVKWGRCYAELKGLC